MTNLNVELGPKRLELMHELVPTATVIAVLVNPANQFAATVTRDLEAAARTLGLQLHFLLRRTVQDIDTTFTDLAQLHAAAVVIGNDPLLQFTDEQLWRSRSVMPYPCLSLSRVCRRHGKSDGVQTAALPTLYRRGGVYIGQDSPGREADGNLPDPTIRRAVELVINLKTAKARSASPSRSRSPAAPTRWSSDVSATSVRLLIRHLVAAARPLAGWALWRRARSRASGCGGSRR